MESAADDEVALRRLRELLSRSSCDLPPSCFTRFQDLLDAVKVETCAWELFVAAVDGAASFTPPDVQVLLPVVAGIAGFRPVTSRVEAPGFFSARLMDQFMDDLAVRATTAEEFTSTLRSGCRVDNATGLPIGRMYLLGFLPGVTEREIIGCTTRIRRKLAVLAVPSYYVDGYVERDVLPDHYHDLVERSDLLWAREPMPRHR